MSIELQSTAYGNLNHYKTYPGILIDLSRETTNIAIVALVATPLRKEKSKRWKSYAELEYSGNVYMCNELVRVTAFHGMVFFCCCPCLLLPIAETE